MTARAIQQLAPLLQIEFPHVRLERNIATARTNVIYAKGLGPNIKFAWTSVNDLVFEAGEVEQAWRCLSSAAEYVTFMANRQHGLALAIVGKWRKWGWR